MRALTRPRLLLLALAGAVALGLVGAQSAFAGAFTPESGGSPNADDIDTLYRIVLYVGLVIFVGVEGALLWALFRFKLKRGGPPALQIRGNTPLEIGWTLGAAVILVVLAVVTFLYLDDITDPSSADPGPRETLAGVAFATIDQPNPPRGRELPIRVNGQQYLWRYDYPGKSGELFSYYEMVVPTDTTVTLKITSQDVVHSWWIPQLGGKADAVPGHTNETWFRISRPGRYGGQCAELCGENHADMRGVVVAKEPADYEAWVRRQKAGIKRSQELLAKSRRNEALR